jgi:hypothetical protein
MANTVLIFTEEALARVRMGLGEIASKFAIPVFNEIEAQIKMAETGAKNYVDAIESHVASVKAKFVAAADDVKTEVSDVKEAVAAVEKAL